MRIMRVIGMPELLVLLGFAFLVFIAVTIFKLVMRSGVVARPCANTGGFPAAGFCTKCGQSLTPGGSFCPFCGTRHA